MRILTKQIMLFFASLNTNKLLLSNLMEYLYKNIAAMTKPREVIVW